MKSFLTSFVLVLSLRAESADSLSGNWNIHTSISGYEGEMGCALTQTEQAVTGKCTSDQGTFAIAGKAAGTKVTLTYETEHEGARLHIVYEVTVDPSTGFKGSVKVPEAGVSGDFTAVRAK